MSATVRETLIARWRRRQAAGVGKELVRTQAQAQASSAAVLAEDQKRATSGVSPPEAEGVRAALAERRPRGRAARDAR